MDVDGCRPRVLSIKFKKYVYHDKKKNTKSESDMFFFLNNNEMCYQCNIIYVQQVL